HQVRAKVAASFTAMPAYTCAAACRSRPSPLRMELPVIMTICSTDAAVSMTMTEVPSVSPNTNPLSGLAETAMTRASQTPNTVDSHMAWEARRSASAMSPLAWADEMTGSAVWLTAMARMTGMPATDWARPVKMPRVSFAAS